MNAASRIRLRVDSGARTAALTLQWYRPVGMAPTGLVLRFECRQPGSNLLHEPLHRLCPLLPGPPILASGEHQHAEAACFLVEALDTVVHRIRVATVGTAVVDEVFHGQVGAGVAGAEEGVQPAG